MLLASLVLCLGLCRLTAQTSVTTLPEAYAVMGFDPHHPSNAVVVLFSDPHMNLWRDVLPIATNIDQRLVNIVNAMDPPPAKIIVSGDTSTTLSPVPGWQPRVWSMNYGTNEMLYWLQSIRAFTNLAQTNILWTPGNHDQLYYETNAETFRLMYPMMPTRQRVDVAGVRFFLLNCGNYGGRDDAQAAWLRDEVAQTSPTQPVVVVTHVPPFLVPPQYRGMGLELREIFGDWPARWWTFSGHYHARSFNVYNIGRSNVASMTVGTANQKNTNGQSHDAGFLFLCLSNGIHGIVYYHYNDSSFEVVPAPDWENPCEFFAAFENVPGLLWSRLKTRDPWPEVTHFEGDDAVEWYAYTRELRWELPLWQHLNQPTHFLLLAISPSASARLEFSADEQSWEQAPLGVPSGFLYRIPIPRHIATQAVAYVRYQGPQLNDFIAGWGLATTNPAPWWPSLSESTLVSTGAMWRYHDAGLSLGAAWRLPNFDDGLWPAGPAPLGFGNGDEATVLAYDVQNKPRTVYFRHAFDLPGTVLTPSLTARLRCDAGAVVYLNGMEVFRYNLPQGEIGYDTPALAPVTGGHEAEFITFPLSGNLLHSSTNVLAVEVHQHTDPTGPVAFWSLDEATPPWQDAAGGHDFTAVGTEVKNGPGWLGGCVTNSGAASSWLQTPDTPALRYAGPFTVGGWFAFGMATGNDPATTCLEKAGEFRLYYTGTTINRYRFGVGGVEVQDQTSGTASGQWRFVVGWYDGTNASIQMDNGPVYSIAALPPTPTSNPLTALKRADGPGGFAADEIFFYPRVLSAEERTALYTTGLPVGMATNTPRLAFDLEMTAMVAQRPAFVEAPNNVVRREGENAAFRLTAASSTPVSYQWQFNGTPLLGATDTLLFLPEVTPAQAGLYALVASNLGGAVTSAPARLTVVLPPPLEIQTLPTGNIALQWPSAEVAATLLRSTNLMDWEAVLTVPPGASATNWLITPEATVTQQFYRLRLDW